MSQILQEKMLELKEGYLPLMEHFYTIQGEGYHSGKAAYFLRLGGCDVGCVWCDVKESWNAALHPQVSMAEMVDFALQMKAKNVVVTGGEPLMYNLQYLTEYIHNKGLNTWIETSGAYALTGSWDWVCLSPKKFKKPVNSIYEHANELKVIVYNKSDFDWAKEHAALVNKACKLYVQPEWSKEQEMLPLMIDFVKQNPEWTISLQTHKYLHIP